MFNPVGGSSARQIFSWGAKAALGLGGATAVANKVFTPKESKVTVLPRKVYEAQKDAQFAEEMKKRIDAAATQEETNTN